VIFGIVLGIFGVAYVIALVRCLNLAVTGSGVGGGGAGGAKAPPKLLMWLKSGKNPGKIRVNLGKICEILCKLPENLGKLPETMSKNGAQPALI